MRTLLAAVTLASLSTVAFGPVTATGREGRSGSVDQAAALAVGRDGKLLVAGVSGREHYGDFTLARYTSSGRLDRNFGVRGKVVTIFGARDEAIANSIATRADGKILVAGSAVARYTRAGKLDRAFGRNGRLLTTSAGGRTNALTLQADGKFLVAGVRSQGFALARYTQRGRLDRSFGRGGKVVTRFGGSSSQAFPLAMAIQPNGRIVVAGGAFTSFESPEKFALARYNADGTLDRSFGNRGRVVTKVGAFGKSAVALVVQPDGRLVVTGPALIERGWGIALVRYTPDGKLDPSFGRRGIAFHAAGTVSALAIQGDGKLVTAGSVIGRYRKFSVTRFLEDGSLDESFGRSGQAVTDFRATAIAAAVAIQADGRIVAAGTVLGRDFALARYTNNGKPDRSFGSSGKVRTDFGNRP
jgi:uncharacterized delta-60 repeat protein